MNEIEYYSRKNNITGEKEEVSEHLQNVAKLTGLFCSEFTKPEIGEVLGWFHDAGKMTERFQNVLNKKETGINHAVIGAMIANNKAFPKFLQTNKKMMQTISSLISAHHSEISIYEETFPDTKKDWNELIGENRYSVSSLNEFVEICKFYQNNLSNGKIPKIDCSLEDSDNLEEMLFTRMLFSCLVDADYSSSAMFFDKKYLETSETKLNAGEELNKLNIYRDNLIKNSNQNSQMNILRNKVFNDCTNASVLNKSIFTLTAPTGTAKTLAMINFALRHAKKYNKKRIFLVLPFLSIITQTVEIYKEIFGENVVLEDDSQTEHMTTDRELCSRWTSPIIVPTSVKFLESLFSSNAITCRKLHNLCNSVIMFDEFQSVSSHLLNATLNTLKLLSEKYGCTIVFASATPPDFAKRKGLEWWDKSTTEIIENVPKLYSDYENIKKMDIEWHLENKLELSDIANKMSKEINTLTIVNTKSIANKLYEVLSKLTDKESVFLISTNLCNAHRSDIIKQIKQRQDNHLPCRIISTQCIEAGVDISCDIVRREIAPFYAIVQSAGRCNRNADKKGYFEIFILKENRYPDDNYRNATEQTRTLCLQFKNEININNLTHLHEYYKKLYLTSGFEKDKIELSDAVKELDFHKTKINYKVIENKDMIRIIVPYNQRIDLYNDFLDLCEKTNFVVSKSDITKMQPIIVNAYRTNNRANSIESYCTQIHIKTKRGKIIGIESDIYLLSKDIKNVQYDEKTGLQLAMKDIENIYIF